WIFFINLPIGVLGFILALRIIPNLRVPDPGPADLRGFALIGIGLGAMALALDNLGRGSLPVWAEAGAGVCTIVCFMFFKRHAQRVLRPAVDLSLLRLPTYRASILGGNAFRIGIGGIPLLLPLMFQLGFGLTPLQSGSL